VTTHYPQFTNIYDGLAVSEKNKLWAACLLYKEGGAALTDEIAVTDLTESLFEKESGRLESVTVANAGNEMVRTFILRTLRDWYANTNTNTTTTKAVSMQTENTVVFAWSQRVDNRQLRATSGFWGLGDALRGMLALYQFCKRNRCEFVLDTHRHPFSAFLETDTSPYHRATAGTSIMFTGDDGGTFTSLKLPLQSGGTHHIFTNVYPELPLLSDEKRLIRSLLCVKSEFQLTLPSQPYSLLHIRTGDGKIDGVISPKELAKYVDLIKKYLKAGDVLCSDSVQLKRYVATEMPDINVNVNDRRSGHVGYDTDPALLRNTLDDMQIVLGAARVFTYSNYGWVSGFVQWGCLCFDIPLVDIKMNS